MTRYRLEPTWAQAAMLTEHCAHARYVWNLAVEQHSHWRPGRAGAPGYVEQARQLTEARREFAWLRAGSVTVQQQALRDFHQAMAAFFRGTHGRPGWRKAGRHEGFRQVGVRPEQVRRVSAHRAQVWVPKVGWVRFRLSRPVPSGVKSYRVTLDSVGRWHIASAHIPAPIPPAGDGRLVGVDRGVVVSAALSTGELLRAPGLSAGERRRGTLLQRKLQRRKKGSRRRFRVRTAFARLKRRLADRRKVWVEQTSTDLARRFDVIGMEKLDVRTITRSARGNVDQPGQNVKAKAGLNRAILANCWGGLSRRLEHKAPGRLIKVRSAFTSQTCSRCGTVDAKARESQAVFACRSCGHRLHADVNAAINIATAAGRAVAARGGQPLGGPANREPQLLLLS